MYVTTCYLFKYYIATVLPSHEGKINRRINVWRSFINNFADFLNFDMFTFSVTAGSSFIFPCPYYNAGTASSKPC